MGRYRWFLGLGIALLSILAASTPASAGRLIWSQDLRALLGADITVLTEPVVSGGKVFVATQKGYSTENGQWVVCLDEGNGKLLWQTKLPGWGAYNQGVTVAAGKVFVGWSQREKKDTGWLYALAKDTGKELWRYDLPEDDGWAGAPRVKDGKVVFASSLGRAYALSEQDGKLVWRTAYLGGFSGGVPVIADIDRDGALEAVFTATGATIVLNLSDGKEEYRSASAYWSVAPPVLVSLKEELAILQLSLNISNYQVVNLRCFDALTGEVVWDNGEISINKGNTTFLSAGQGAVFFGTCGKDREGWNSRELYAYDVTTGKLLWKRSLDSGVVTSPSLTASGEVLLKTSGYLYALSAKDGSEIWKEAVVSGGQGDPPGGIALNGNACFFASFEGTVYSFKLDGKEKKDWSLRGGDWSTGKQQ